MSHLDDLAAALVDGELPPDQRDRALAHLAGCAACRDEVDVQRRLKARLAAAGAPPIPSDLTVRLLAIPSTAPEPEVRRRGALPVGGPRGRRPAGRTVPARAPRRARRMAGSLSALVVVLGGAMLLGGEKQGVEPPVGAFVVEHTATNGQMPLSDPAAGVLLTSYTP